MKTIKTTLLAASIISLLSFGASQTVVAKQTTVDNMSKQLHVRYQVIDNHAAANGTDCSVLGADWGACNKATISLYNKGNEIKDKDWAIYFHSIRMILAVQNDQFKVTHLTGDLHRLEPTDKFKGFPARELVEIPIIGEYWQVSQTDVMPRWYVTSTNATPKTIMNTDTENLSDFVAPISSDQWKRTPDDKNILMTPTSRFDRNKEVTLLEEHQLRGQIIPTPTRVSIDNIDIVLGSKGVNLSLQGVNKNSQAVLEHRFKLLNIPVTLNGYKINTVIEPGQFKNGVPGAYTLNIDEKEATVVGYDESGAFYGVQSILSLIPTNDKPIIAKLKAEDAPRFEYRGVMVDIGRNFRSKDAVLRLLDQMAVYKLNKFHFHLSDDEGWRIEIPGLPELTQIGSQRCHDLTERTCLLPQLGSGPDSNNMGSGYLTKSDYIEIVKYAKDRFIEVIPEVDMPAHARAAVVAMEARYARLQAEGKEKEANEYRLVDPTDTSNTTSVQFYNRQSYLNPCLDSSVRFADKVISEIAKMHVVAGQPLTTWHFGGDEAKNIHLGGGYQDIKTADKVNWRGTIDQSIEDHPWAKSQACQVFIAKGIVEDIEHLPSYFAVEVSEKIKNHGINRMQAWQDGLKHAENANTFATDKVAVNFWDTVYWGGADSVNEWANKGYQVIISNPDYVYLDMPNEVTPLERGYYWAARFNSDQKIFSFAPNNLPQNAETSVDRDGNVFSAKGSTNWPGAYGLSAQIWGESVRNDQQMEYMVFPRLLAIAERSWHKADWELDYVPGREYKQGATNYVDQAVLSADWTRFANLVGQRELAKLDLSGIEYRLPVPGAQIIKNQLVANIIFPGLTIEYSTDNGKSWTEYKEPVAIGSKDKVLVRSTNSGIQRVSRAEAVN